MANEIKDARHIVWKRSRLGLNEGMLVLFKFGQEEHLTSFRNQGQMHMRTMRYFAGEESENLARGDRFEGAARLFQPADLRMTISHPLVGTHEVDPKDLVGPVVMSYNSEADQNIFCMFSLTEPMSKPLLHENHLRLGTHFLLVLNCIEFFRRVHKALVNLGLRGTRGLVEYYDDTSYTGNIGPFRKSNRFAYQKEYRVVVQPGIPPFRNLMIGNISDITTPVLPLSDLDKLVDFSEEAAAIDGWVKTELLHPRHRDS